MMIMTDKNEGEKKIGVVTVLYNSADVLEDFFESLNMQTYNCFCLYIVDNNSPDESLKRCKELLPNMNFSFKLIEEKQNWGVAKGNNIGIAAAIEDDCAFVLLSNNDTILDKDCISILMWEMKSHPVTMAVPKIFYHGTNKLWFAGGDFVYYSGFTKHWGVNQEDKGQFDLLKYIKYAPTCFMLIKKEVFQRVGMMDEKFFVYYDDTDFVYRAVIKGEEKLLFVPSATLWHKESISVGGPGSDFALRYMSRNAVYFSKKNHHYFQRMVVKMYRIFCYLFVKPFVLDVRQRSIVKAAFKEGDMLSHE